MTIRFTDQASGQVIAEQAAGIGVATNNVAEYRGLIAGLELYNEHTPGADLEVRMDSKLVIEQMSGNWKIKHPDMKPLAMAANRLAPFGTTWTWIPRERNTHADALLNEALDTAMGRPSRRTRVAEVPVEEQPVPQARMVGWSRDLGSPTTLILVRHGETDHTTEKRFSGRAGDDPSLNADGRAQVRAVADWLAPLAEEIDAVLASPLRRTRETAEIIAAGMPDPHRIRDLIKNRQPEVD